MRRNSIRTRDTFIFFVCLKVNPVSNTLLICLLGMAIAADSNQSLTGLFCKLANLGGVHSTPINISSGKMYPWGISALLPTKLLLTITVFSRISCWPLISISPSVTASAINDLLPILSNEWVTLLAEEISVFLPTFAPSALKKPEMKTLANIGWRIIRHKAISWSASVDKTNCRSNVCLV